MFPLLLSPLLTAVTSVASGAGSLAVGAVKTAAKAVSATDKAVEDSDTVTDKSGKEWDRDSPQGKTIAAAQAKAEEEAEPKDLFGGLDLAKVKSAIDDKGPMGPEEEGPKTVYKQMIKQLQNISSTLLRMEETLRMLLSIEYERIQGMVRQDRDTTLKVGDTDETIEKKRGILGRGKDMLGGAYGKVKDKLTGSTFGKMLGLGALILAFKKYPDQIKFALEKVLEFFKGVFDYFSADDFTWEKFKTDWVDIFYPKMKGILMGALDWLWNAIKGITKEFLLGASGDKAIRQGTKSREESVAGLKELDETLDFDKVYHEKGPSGFGLSQGKINVTPSGLKRLGIEDDSPEAQRLNANLDDAISSMRKITRESDGRIQFKGLPDMTQTSKIHKLLRDGEISINDILNATPIIDGIESSFEALKNFKLYESAGVTKETDEAIRESITENLAQMSEITRMLNDPTTDREHLGKKNDGKINIGTWVNPKFVTDAEARAHIETLRADNLTLGAFSSEVFNEPVSTLIDTDGTTPIQKDLKTTAGGPRDSFNKWDKSMGGTRKWDSGTNSWISINAPTTTTVMTKNEMANHLAAENPNWTQRLFAEKALLETT